MPILGIIASSFRSAGGGPVGAYDSLATVTLSATTSSITFTGIPSGYKHLQIRGISRDTRTGANEQSVMMRFNGDSGSNYSLHILEGYGSGTPTSGATTSSTQIKISLSPTADATSNIFGGFVADVLDYSSTVKNKTSRSLYGDDQNGSGTVGFASGAWYNTGAITSINIYPTNSQSFVAYSQFALYGVK
jgi:hypothetical protein